MEIDTDNIQKWVDEFARKHLEKGSHRWAFWVEGVIIGIILCNIW